MSQECPICFDDICVSTTGCVEMSCSHKFHLKCIGKWLNKNSTCPMCRNKPSELETLQEEPPAYGIGSRTYGNGSRTYGFGSRIRMNEWINSAIDDYQITIRTNHTNTSLTVNASDIVPEPLVTIPDTDGIPGVDIRLVSQQTGVTAEQALDALRRNTGDIVNSIMELTNSS